MCFRFLRRLFCRGRCWSVLLVGCGLVLLYAGLALGQQVVQQLTATACYSAPPGNALNPQVPWQSTATSGGAAQIKTTIPPVPGKIIYLQGVVITGSGATAATTVTATFASGGTTVMNIDIPVVAIATNNQGQVLFSPSIPFPMPVAGQNLVVTVPTFGAGNTASSLTIWGFYQ